MEQGLITLICCGKAGVGKSSLGNHILTGHPQSDLFPQGGDEGGNEDSDEGSDKEEEGYGLTRQIVGHTRNRKLPDGTYRDIQYIDVPGTGDPTLDTFTMLENIEKNYKQTKLNVCLMLVSAQDIRKTLQEAFSCAFFTAFFENNGLSTKDILWLVVTRSQEKEVGNSWIKKKLKSLKSDGLDIDPSHVIKYKLGDTDSLTPLLQHIAEQSSNEGYNFKHDLDQGAQEFESKMDAIANRNKQLKDDLEKLKLKMETVQSENQSLNEQQDQMKKEQDTFKEESKKSQENLQSQLNNEKKRSDDLVNQCNNLRNQVNSCGRRRRRRCNIF